MPKSNFAKTLRKHRNNQQRELIEYGGKPIQKYLYRLGIFRINQQPDLIRVTQYFIV